LRSCRRSDEAPTASAPIRPGRGIFNGENCELMNHLGHRSRHSSVEPGRRIQFLARAWGRLDTGSSPVQWAIARFRNRRPTAQICGDQAYIVARRDRERVGALRSRRVGRALDEMAQGDQRQAFRRDRLDAPVSYPQDWKTDRIAGYGIANRRAEAPGAFEDHSQMVSADSRLRAWAERIRTSRWCFGHLQPSGNEPSPCCSSMMMPRWRILCPCYLSARDLQRLAPATAK
jgi:hypothetical protein